MSAAGTGGAPEHTLTPKSLAIQKGVTIAIDTGAAGASPGDTLQYTLDVQVSDFFAMQDLVVTDVISDGQRRDPGFVPTLTIAEHSGGATTGAMAPANATFVVSGTTGETTTTFQVAAEQVLRGLDARLVGGCVPAMGTGGPLPDCAMFNGGADDGPGDLPHDHPGHLRLPVAGRPVGRSRRHPRQRGHGRRGPPPGEQRHDAHRA